jgi:hypothetical protein
MKRARPPRLEVLEDRTAPAIYGVPWADPRHLTLSFAPDGTQIAGQASNLFAALNAEMPTATWEAEVLAAVQAWAVNANISVGVVPDGGEPFGAPGLTQGDPRFGDIRIGAQPMGPGTLSVSVPHDPYLSGTWSGDILLNSNIDFTAPGSNLYGVLLHEIGHVLGLPDNDDLTSAMYRDAASQPAALSAADVAALQALYGPPIDLNEGTTGNSTFQTATPIVSPSHHSTPLVAFGALTAAGDVDVFSVATPREPGPMTFRLQTAGISLLEPSLTVYDSSGNIVGQAQSTNVLGDVVTVTPSSVAANSVYYLQVAGATQDEFSVGRYGVAVTFDAAEMEMTPAQIDAQIASVLRGPYDTLSPAQLAQVFRNPEGGLHTGLPLHNTLATALVVTSTAGDEQGEHYEVIDHLGEGPAYYAIQAPEDTSGDPLVLTAAVNAFTPAGSTARAQLFDSQGQLVAANVLVDGNGTFTLQAANVVPGQTYYLELRVPESEMEGNGNCSLVVDFGQPPALSREFVAGTLTPAAPQQSYALYVAQTQLFQFALSVDTPSARSRSSVELTITDQSGNVVFDLVAPAGQTASGTSVLLTPGAYTARFTAIKGRGPASALTYSLHGSNLTDPIGPALNDPTLQPLYTQPPMVPPTPPSPNTLYYFSYSGGVVIYVPFLSMMPPGGSPVLPTNPLPNGAYYYYPDGSVLLDPFLWVPLGL